jgi:hypothetical protein
MRLASYVPGELIPLPLSGSVTDGGVTRTNTWRSIQLLFRNWSAASLNGPGDSRHRACEVWGRMTR